MTDKPEKDGQGSTAEDSIQSTKGRESSDLDSQSLRMALKAIWVEFFNQTTLHGCKKVQEGHRRVLNRCIWFTILIAMAATLTYILIYLYFRYHARTFITVWGLRRETELPAPGITLCLPTFIDSVLLAESHQTIQEYFKKRSREWIDVTNELTNEKGKDDPDFEVLTYSDLDHEVGFSGEFIFLQSWITMQGDLQSLHELFFKLDLRHEKACWSLDPSHLSRANGNKDIKWMMDDTIRLMVNIRQDRYLPGTAEAGLELYLHEPYSTHESVKPIRIKPGTYAKVLFSTTHFKFLPLPFKSFGEGGCLDVDSPDFVNPLRMSAKYSSEACMKELAYNASAELCGCVLLEARTIYGLPECSILNYRRCAEGVMHLAETGEMKAQKAGKGQCPHACSYYKFDSTVSSVAFPPENSIPSFIKLRYIQSNEDAKQNLLMLQIDAADYMLTTQEHVPEITLESICASVGGYMGLFLGASLLTLTELVEAILVSLWIIHTKLYYGRKK